VDNHQQLSAAKPPAVHETILDDSGDVGHRRLPGEK
jgi:hypothetical protein